MSVTEPQPAVPESTRRWLRLAPDRLILTLVAVQGLLYLSERFQWFPFNAHKGWTVLIAVASIGLFLLLMLLWFIGALCFHWRFQYGLRSLLLLTVAVAIAFGWLASEMKKSREQNEFVRVVKATGGGVLYDGFYSPTGDGGVVSWYAGRGYGPKMPHESAPLFPYLGRDFFARITTVCLADECTDDTLAALGPQIERLEQLDFLGIYSNAVTDAGLAHIAKVRQLRRSRVFSACVTDEGLAHLTELTNLTDLEIGRGSVTDSGVKKLRVALPKCDIRHWH